jgi:hypothetical protein
MSTYRQQLSDDQVKTIQDILLKRKSIEATLQILMNATLDAATKKQEVIAQQLQDWWANAGIQYNKDFLRGAFTIEIKDGVTYIISYEGANTTADVFTHVTNTRLDS